MTDIAVHFNDVTIVLGKDPERAVPMIGQSREAVKQETGQVMAVQQCSLTVNRGEIMVLMGLSGSGKSSLLRAVNGLNPVTRGDVQVWNGTRMVSVPNADKRDLRALRLRSVAMVFQQFALLPWRTVAENVGLGLELGGLAPAARAEKVRAQLAMVGLSEWADRRVDELSGGMQQRVGLARAFATDAPILLMDEPFSALDPLIRTRLQDELLELQAKTGRTIIFVSHDLDEAFRIGNRIALMEGGRIVQVGSARQIVAHPANDYVRDFVAAVNPMGVLTAADLAETGDAEGHALDPAMPLPAVMAALCQTEMLPLMGGGRISRAGVLSRLAAG